MQAKAEKGGENGINGTVQHVITVTLGLLLAAPLLWGHTQAEEQVWDL